MVALLVLAACGGNGGTGTSNMAEPEPRANLQGRLDEATAQRRETRNEDGLRFEDYYTFGDTFVIFGQWEFTFLENPVVIYPVREPLEGELDTVLGPRFERAYENGVVAFPVIVTNVSGVYQPQGMVSGEVIHDPSDNRQDWLGDLIVAPAIMWRQWFETGEFPPLGELNEPGSTSEGYIFAIYGGDGDYWWTWSNVHVRLPISR